MRVVEVLSLHMFRTEPPFDLCHVMSWYPVGIRVVLGAAIFTPSFQYSVPERAL